MQARPLLLVATPMPKVGARAKAGAGERAKAGAFAYTDFFVDVRCHSLTFATCLWPTINPLLNEWRKLSACVNGAGSFFSRVRFMAD